VQYVPVDLEGIVSVQYEPVDLEGIDSVLYEPVDLEGIDSVLYEPADLEDIVSVQYKPVDLEHVGAHTAQQLQQGKHLVHAPTGTTQPLCHSTTIRLYMSYAVFKLLIFKSNNLKLDWCFRKRKQSCLPPYVTVWNQIFLKRKVKS